MKDIDKAVSLLSNDITLAIVKKDSVFTSNKKGISALFEYVRNKTLEGASVADKIIGKAAALLMIYGKADRVYGRTISRGATQALKAHNIPYSYCILAEKIQNRTKDGLCPMELAVINLTEPKDALLAVEKKLKELGSS